MRPPATPDETWTDTSRGRTLKGILALPLFAFVAALSAVSPLWVRWKNKNEARGELKRLVSEQEQHTFDRLRSLIGRRKRVEFTTVGGTWYQAVIEVMWDDQPDGTIRVLVSLDDGGASAFHPMTDSVLIEPQAPS